MSGRSSADLVANACIRRLIVSRITDYLAEDGGESILVNLSVFFFFYFFGRGGSPEP